MQCKVQHMIYGTKFVWPFELKDAVYKYKTTSTTSKFEQNLFTRARERVFKFRNDMHMIVVTFKAAQWYTNEDGCRVVLNDRESCFFGMALPLVVKLCSQQQLLKYIRNLVADDLYAMGLCANWSTMSVKKMFFKDKIISLSEFRKERTFFFDDDCKKQDASKSVCIVVKEDKVFVWQSIVEIASVFCHTYLPAYVILEIVKKLFPRVNDTIQDKKIVKVCQSFRTMRKNKSI